MMPEGEVPETLELADEALTMVTPDEETPVEVPSEEPEAEGQPRDESGRFASPAEAEETPPGELPPEPVDSPEPRDEPTEAVEGETAPEEEYPEASYEVDGQQITLSGTAVGTDGVFIAPETWEQDVAPQLAAARELQSTYRQRMSEVAQREQAAEASVQAAKAESQHVLAHFETLLEKSQDAFRVGTAEALLNSPVGQWLLSAGQGWPILKAEARVKAIELSNQQATRRLEEYTQREQAERNRPLMASAVRSSIRQQGQALGLDEQTLQAVEQKLSDPGYQRLLFVPAPFDDPNGLFKKGEMVIDHGVVAGALDLVAMNRQERQQMQKIEAAKRENAKLQPPRKIAPTVGAKGRSPAGPAIPQPKTAKEADDLLLEGNLDWAEVET